MGRAASNSGFEVAAHPHREVCKAIVCSQRGKQAEVRGGVVAIRGDAHQAPDRQVGLTAGSDEAAGVGRQAACLLGFGARVDLDEQGRRPATFLGQSGQCIDKAGTVDTVDGVEEFDGRAGLVGLKRSDQVKFDPAEFGRECRPAALRLLNSVFAEDALPGGENGADTVFGLGL